MIKKAFLYVLFLTLSTVLAQEPVSIHLTEDDGVPDKEFYDVLEDENGFIWLAADKGLYRYDGNEYKLFTHPDQVGLSVFSLIKDEEGTVWYTNLANQIFRIKNNTVELVANLKDKFSGNLFNVHVQDEKLICSNYFAVVILNKNSLKLLFEGKKHDDYYTTGTPVFITKESISYVIYGKVINISFKNFKERVVSEDFKLKFKNIISIHTKIDDDKYFTSLRNKKGVNSFYVFSSYINNDHKRIEIDLGTITDRIYDIKKIDDKIFILTTNGIYQTRIHKNKLSIEKHFFKQVNVTDLLKDKQGNLWITTLHNGIFIVPNFDINLNFNSPGYNSIRKIMLGNEDELFLLGKEKEKELYLFNATSKETIDIGNAGISEIKYIFKFPETEKYFYQDVLVKNVFSIDDDHINVISKFNSLSGVIKDHHFIDKENVLIATGNNFFSMSINANNFNDIDIKYISKHRSFSCYYSKPNKMAYFSNVNGFFALDDNNKRIEIKNKNKPLNIKDIQSIDGKTIWCLSFKNGLYEVKDNQIVHHYNTENGMLSDINSFIEIDQTNNAIWIAGERGIQEFNIATREFQNLTKKDGIPSYDFTGLNIIDNTVYIGTQTKLFSFNSNTIFENKIVTKPDVYFTKLLIDGREVNLEKKYVFEHDTQQIQINYNTNGFKSNEVIDYKYRLIEPNNKDTEWQNETSKSNKIVYNKLPQGNYTFQIKAINDNTESNIKSFKFKVKGVFYKQWWFYLLSSLLIVLLVIVYFKRKNKELKERQRLLMDRQKKETENTFLKLESLRSQMNPHFIFNALNSIQDYILRNEKKIARNYLVKFSNLIRMFLEHSQKDLISLDEEISALTLYLELEKDRFEDTFHYSLELDESIDAKTIEIPTFLVQPYIENAIKHGLLHIKDNRKLVVSFKKCIDTNSLLVFIEDNGIGRIASERINNKNPLKPESFSSKANQKRIELINKTRKHPIKFLIEDLDVNNEKAPGTKVKLTIPLTS